MRIIAGKYKGRNLRTPALHKKTRPTTDSARETIFNILENRINFQGKIVMDLFCGTGSIGIECLSRGAVKCYFVDTDISHIKKNIPVLDITDAGIIKRSEAVRFLKKFRSDDDYNDYYLIFADPPYIYSNYDELLESAAKINCIFILEHTIRFVPDKKNKFLLLTRKSGVTEFSIFDFRKNK